MRVEMGNHPAPIVWPDPSQPRIDTVVKRDGEVRVLTGTPTVGATAANRLGCAAVPEGWGVESYVLIRPNAHQITEADITPNLWTPAFDADIARLEAEIAPASSG